MTGREKVLPFSQLRQCLSASSTSGPARTEECDVSGHNAAQHFRIAEDGPASQIRAMRHEMILEAAKVVGCSGHFCLIRSAASILEVD